MLNPRKRVFEGNSSNETSPVYVKWSSISQQVLVSLLHLADVTKTFRFTKMGTSSLNMPCIVLSHMMLDQMINENLYAKHNIVADRIHEGTYDAAALKIIKDSLGASYTNSKGVFIDSKIQNYARHIGVEIPEKTMSKLNSYFNLRDMIYHADIATLTKNQTPGIAADFMREFQLDPTAFGETDVDWPHICFSNVSLNRIYADLKSQVCPILIDQTLGERCRFKAHASGWADLSASGFIGDLKRSGRMLPSATSLLSADAKNALFSLMESFAEDNDLIIVDKDSREQVSVRFRSDDEDEEDHNPPSP